MRASVWKETPLSIPHCMGALLPFLMQVASCMLHVLQVLQDGRHRLFNMPVSPFFLSSHSHSHPNEMIDDVAKY